MSVFSLVHVCGERGIGTINTAVGLGSRSKECLVLT